MFKRLVELIKEALKSLTKYNSVGDTITDIDVYTIGEAMQNAIDKWLKMYKDESPWLDDGKGIYSLGLSKLICQSLAAQVLSEMDLTINTPGQEVAEEEIDESTMSGFIYKTLQDHFLNKLPDYVEKAMATGGVIFKPYISNDTIYIDTSYQGRFYPLAFDDDGNITDIAFSDQFTAGNTIYTKIERQIFNTVAHTLTVINKVYKAETKPDAKEQMQELGAEIDIKSIPRWAFIEPEVTLEGVEKPLFGYYKIPLANNIDLDCPLGVAVFSPATSMIERADMQFSRLDWEYEGGQLAINVDPTAIHPGGGYYGTTSFDQDQCRDRLYKCLDLGQDDTYHEFAPGLRDTNYISGLDNYLCRIEDICGLARGTISSVEAEARTATEVRILKQRTYTTINSNQAALEKALKDLADAIYAYASMYGLAVNGQYVVNIEWSDSVLTDVNEELNQKVMLEQEGVLSKAELRSWYLGEDLETAKIAIQEISSEAMQGMMSDNFYQEGSTGGGEGTGSEDLDAYGEEVAGMLDDLLKELG